VSTANIKSGRKKRGREELKRAEPRDQQGSTTKRVREVEK
jgi:hypothetical protein